MHSMMLCENQRMIWACYAATGSEHLVVIQLTMNFSVHQSTLESEPLDLALIISHPFGSKYLGVTVVLFWRCINRIEQNPFIKKESFMPHGYSNFLLLMQKTLFVKKCMKLL